MPVHVGPGPGIEYLFDLPRKSLWTDRPHDVRQYVQESYDHNRNIFGDDWTWGVALVDIQWWMATGSQLTNIPWAGWRGFALVVWPVLTTGTVDIADPLNGQFLKE